jgi:acyl-CoA synthetase (AMP-forming)/AMP-acid ligase II
MVELLRTRALDQGGHRAFTFLGDGETETDSLTYAELDLRARALATLLQEQRVSGERVVLLHPPGLDFVVAFFGCLYAGAIAVPAYPPKHNRNLLRLHSIISDAQPSMALTTTPVLARLESTIKEDINLGSMRWLAMDVLDPSAAQCWREPSITGKSLAFLQYTSGSTATPKGVMVSHENILHTTADIRHGLEHKPDSVMVTWLPAFHDLGLIEGILQPTITGFPSIMMPPSAFLQQPGRWLRAITRYRGTYSAGPNFAYDLCIKKTTPEQREMLDLSSWEVAVTAAEPVNKGTMEDFYEAFAACGFRWRAFCPSYGLAEATLKVSASKKPSGPVFCTVEAATLEQNKLIEVPANHTAHVSEQKQSTRTIVGCGNAQSVKFKTIVTIAHPETMEQCSPDQVGEIWVSSPSVAQGYWNKPEETTRTFQAYLADTGEGPFLRTGDLGFLRDGELYITGRLKDLIIIEGRNHYPQDIEKTVEDTHPALHAGCSAAFSVITNGKERLVVAIEVNRYYRPLVESTTGELTASREGAQMLDTKKLLKQVRAAVAEEHDILLSELVLLKTGTIPKTSSGKIQRQACRAGYINQTLELWSDSYHGSVSQSQGNSRSKDQILRDCRPRNPPLGRQTSAIKRKHNEDTERSGHSGVASLTTIRSAVCGT